MNLGFIITGNLRTFFTEVVHKHFCNWLSALREGYTIHMVCVISDHYDPEAFKFLSSFCQYTLVSFRSDIHYPDQSFYDSVDTGQSHQDKKNQVTSFLYQRKQFQIGFQTLDAKGLDIQHWIKTRFDIVMKKNLIPFSHPSELFPHCPELETDHEDFYKKFGIQNMTECIEFQRHLNSTHREIRIREDFYKISLGGSYFYNLDIQNPSPKLWLFNDFIFIGTYDTVKRYAECKELLEDPSGYTRIARQKNIHRFLCPEIILSAYLYSAGITPIVCLRDDVFPIARTL